MPHQPLLHRVCVVAGASRGAGRGIARMLGAAGATAYCTGRSARGRPATVGRPEATKETPEVAHPADRGAVGVAKLTLTCKPVLA